MPERQKSQVRRIESDGWRFRGGTVIGGLGSAVSSRSGVWTESRGGFGVFRSFRNQQLLPTTHYSPVMLTANFNEMRIPVWYDSFDHVGLKSQQVKSKPQQVGL